MTNPQVTILTCFVIIIVLLIQYCRAATKARSLATSHQLDSAAAASLERTLNNLRFSHDCEIRAMKRKHKVQEDSLRSLRHALHSRSTIKCLTFQTRADGLKRYTVGHQIAGITMKRGLSELTVICHRDNGSSSSTTFKMADITGPIQVDRAD